MQKVMRLMCGAGDRNVAEWDTETVTPERLAEIETEFKAWINKGNWAGNLNDETLVKVFDPEADILLIPRMQGGRPTTS